MSRAGLLVAMATSVAALLGCGGEGTILAPAPNDGSGAGGEGAGTTSTSSSGGSTPTPQPKREVYQRNPYGNVAAAGNLLWDGDFEWRPAFASQYGWIQAENQNFAGAGLPKPVLGGACRSGIRCTRLEAGNVLIGLAVVSEDEELATSVWLYPEGEDDCASVDVLLVSQDGSEPGVQLTADPVGDDGWCRVAATTPVLASAQYLYLQNNAFEGSFLVDDAVIVRASEAPAQMLSLKNRPTGPVDPAVVSKARNLGRHLLELKDPPPSAAKQAFEKRIKRRWRTGVGR
jgi:hypothetical protein